MGFDDSASALHLFNRDGQFVVQHRKIWQQGDEESSQQGNEKNYSHIVDISQNISQNDTDNSTTLHFEGWIDLTDCCANNHFQLPSGVKDGKATLTWDSNIVNLDFRVGIGEDPHNGTVVAKNDTGSFGNSEGIKTLVLKNNTAFEEGAGEKWFAQGKSDNGYTDPKYSRTKVRYTMDIVLYFGIVKI